MKKQVKFDRVAVYIFGADEIATYFEDNEYKLKDTNEITRLFGLEPFHYSTALADFDTERLNSFNTYNWGAPVTLCGVYSEQMDFALVNVHLGGDPRGNYSAPYICDVEDHVNTLLAQDTELYIELSDGTEYSMFCDNGEAYFDFDTFDPYCVDFDEPLTDEQIAEIKEKMEVLK